MADLGGRVETDVNAVAEAAGFADSSGFTRLGQRVSVERSADLVDRFEDTAFDVVASRGRARGEAHRRRDDVRRRWPMAVDIGFDLVIGSPRSWACLTSTAASLSAARLPWEATYSSRRPIAPLVSPRSLAAARS